MTYYPSGFCSHFTTRCENTRAVNGANSYSMDVDPQSQISDKYVNRKCDETPSARSYVFHFDFCLDTCAQSSKCNSMTYDSDGHCLHFSGPCNKMTSKSGSTSAKVKPYSLSPHYDEQASIDQDHSKYMPQTSKYSLTLKDCLQSCSSNDDCKSVTYFYDGFCSQFGDYNNPKKKL